MSAILASAAGGLLNIGSSILGNRYAKKRDERQFQHNKEMSDLAWNRELEQWKRANEYNAPVNQMARLREAGLNPAMIYGSGGAKTQASTSPKYQAPRADYRSELALPLTGLVNQYQDFRMKNAQIDLLKAQQKTAEAEASAAPRYYDYRAYGTAKSAQRRAYDLGLQLGTGQFIDMKGNKFRYAKTPGAKKYAYQLQGMDAINRAREVQIQSISKRNELLDKDIQYYLANRFGTAVTNIVGKGIGAAMKGVKSLRGAKKFVPRQSNSSWQNYKRLDPVTGEIW